MEILGIAILLMLGGCLGKDGAVKEQDKTDTVSAETSEFLFLEVEKFLAAVQSP